jgi:hypothetical protein
MKGIAFLLSEKITAPCNQLVTREKYCYESMMHNL